MSRNYFFNRLILMLLLVANVLPFANVCGVAAADEEKNETVSRRYKREVYRFAQFCNFKNTVVRSSDVRFLHLKSYKGDHGYVMSFVRCQFQPGALEQVLNCVGPEEVTFENCSLDDKNWFGKSAITSVTKLKITGTQIKDDNLRMLSNFPSLVFLDLTGTSINGSCLEDVCKLGKLEELRLRDTALSDQYLKHIENCRRLKLLDIAGTSCTADGFSKIRFFPELEHFGASYWNEPDDWFRIFMEQPKLHEGLTNWVFRFNNCSLTDEGFSKLRSKVEIKYLDLSGTYVTDKALRHLSQFTTLYLLSLNNCRITGEGFENVVPGILDQVELDQTCLTKRGLESLFKHKSIRQLSLCGALPVDKDRLNGLGSLSKLSYLSMGNNPLYLEDMRNIVKLPQLSCLVLNDCSVCPELLSVLRDCPALQELHLGNCRGFGQESISELMKLHHVSLLDLTKSKISQSNVSLLRKKMPSCHITAND